MIYYVTSFNILKIVLRELILILELCVVSETTLDSLYEQSRILDGAIGVADAMFYPHQSLLDLSTLVARKFQRIHSDIIGLRHEIRPELASHNEMSVVGMQLPKTLFIAVDQMWR
jgi:hypothetical protein